MIAFGKILNKIRLETTLDDERQASSNQENALIISGSSVDPSSNDLLSIMESNLKDEITPNS